MACENGVCVNTAGSFNCFCSPPLVLDATRRRCVSTNNTEGTVDPERNTNYHIKTTKMNYALIAIEGFRGLHLYLHFFPLYYDADALVTDDNMDICWQRLEEGKMCADPLQGRRTTFTECCCLFGFAWSGQCALCPRRDSGET